MTDGPGHFAWCRWDTYSSTHSGQKVISRSLTVPKHFAKLKTPCQCIHTLKLTLLSTTVHHFSRLEQLLFKETSPQSCHKRLCYSIVVDRLQQWLQMARRQWCQRDSDVVLVMSWAVVLKALLWSHSTWTELWYQAVLFLLLLPQSLFTLRSYSPTQMTWSFPLLVPYALSAIITISLAGCDQKEWRLRRAIWSMKVRPPYM